MKSVTKKEILIVFLFYVFFSGIYNITLWYNIGGYEDDGFWGWTNLEDYWYRAGMSYVFYFLASILIWFLGIYVLRSQKKIVQIFAVFILIGVVTYYVRELRYSILDAYEIGHLRGTGSVWDWYIPFLFMTIQFGCFFAYRYFKDNQERLILENQLRTSVLNSELSALKAQLNPHFLYNIFNTISASVPAENERTRRMIAQLSDLFRYQLKASNSETVLLKEELDFIQKYLDLEKERFGERLEVEINVEDNLYNEQIPPMILQPLVENAVKHGLSSLIEGGKIEIRITKEDDKLHFEIADNGIGISNKIEVFNKGIGLTNTKLRLEKKFNSTLNLSDNLPRGLRVSFTI